MAQGKSLFSTMVRAGRTTYFVDVKEAKNGNKYLSIAETRINGEERKRVSLRVFGEAVQDFRQAVDEAVAALSQ
jgi:hypothetical protein